MLSGCYIPCFDIQTYTMRYKRDKASGTWFDPLIIYGGLNLFVIGRCEYIFNKYLNIFDNLHLILYLIMVP